MVINLGETMRRTVFSISLLALLASCGKEPTIDRAEYLEKIFPNHPGYKTFLVKANYFNKPSCQYLENWAKANVKTTLKKEREQYTFLSYDDEITAKNPYLEKEYDAIGDHYVICEMFNDDYQCFNCNDD